MTRQMAKWFVVALVLGTSGVLAWAVPTDEATTIEAGDEVAQDGTGDAVAQDEVAGGTISGTVEGRARFVPNTLVYLEAVEGEFTQPEEGYTMDQEGMEFAPFLLPVVQGGTVTYLNNDNVVHNVYSPDNEGFDLGEWAQGESRDHLYDALGVYTQLCNIHPQMIGYVVVLQNPFFAVTGEDGLFTLENVPAGTYNVLVWNERKEADPVSVTVEAGGAATIAVELQ